MTTKSKAAKAGRAVGGVESGASKVTSLVDDGHKTLVIAALERGIKQIEGTLTNPKARPAEGSFPVKLEVHVTGDVTVGAARAGEMKPVLDFKDRDLLVALVGTLKNYAVRKGSIEAALKALSKARAQSRAKAELDAIDAEVAELINAIAPGVGLTTDKPVGARAGSVGGKPSVCVKADVGEHSVSFTI